MPNIKTTKFRREAEECRRNAEQARNLIDRGSWLRLADDLMKLARSEDLRIKVVDLKWLRDFTATATADSDVSCPIYGDNTDDSELAAGPVFH